MAMSREEQEEAYDALDEHGFYRLPDQWELKEYHTIKFSIESCSAVRENTAIDF